MWPHWTMAPKHQPNGMLIKNWEAGIWPTFVLASVQSNNDKLHLKQNRNSWSGYLRVYLVTDKMTNIFHNQLSISVVVDCFRACKLIVVIYLIPFLCRSHFLSVSYTAKPSIPRRHSKNISRSTSKNKTCHRQIKINWFRLWCNSLRIHNPANVRLQHTLIIIIHWYLMENNNEKLHFAFLIQRIQLKYVSLFRYLFLIDIYLTDVCDEWSCPL